MRRFLTFLAILSAAPASAQMPDFTKTQIKVERLAPGVAVLFGEGGNIGVSFGEDGNILVDDQYAPLTPKILAAVAALDPDPVKFVVNTHWHFDHSGGNENLGKAGAVIVAHDNVRKRMSTDQFMAAFKRRFPPSPKAALPVVTFAQGVTIHLNGDELQIVHVPHAHTDGDALIYFRRAKVLHMGDTFVRKVMLPFIDLSSGGSIDGLIAASRTALALVPEDVKIIPGHGPIATKADLRAYLAMLEDVRGKVAAARSAGRSLDQVKAMKIAAPYEMKGSYVSGDSFIEAIWSSLPTR
jgi:cyclase